MSISKTLSADGQELTISIQGRFDFSSHQSFRGAYESAGVTNFVIDLRDTTYLDSSALGMLLLLRDYAGGEGASVKLIHCNDEVKRILDISKFGQLFEIK